MREVVTTHNLPGLSVGLVVDESLVFAESIGYAELETKTPLTPEHGQRIASITKTMIGLCAMALVDEGKLRLDERVSDLLPDVIFDGPSHDMMVRHLLTHTSGIGEAPTIERLKDVATPNRAAVRSVGEFSELYPDGVVVEVPPGVKWAYCNNGYALLGEIVRRKEGNHELQDIMQRRIWGPLRMHDTHIRDEPHEHLAAGYHRAPNADTRFQLERAGIEVRDEDTVDGTNIRGAFTPDFNKAMRAAGGVQSTLPDMARYASALVKQGAGLVSAGSFASMVAPQWCPDERLNHWGLAFARAPHHGRVAFGHGGAYFGGWNSHLDVFADDGFAVLQHMNIMLDEPAPVFRRIIRAALAVEPMRYEDMPTDRTMLAHAPGEYWLTMPGTLTNFRPATRLGPVRVERDGDALTLTARWGNWKGGVPLLAADPADPSLFAINREDDDAALLVFERDGAGNVTGLRCDELTYLQKREHDA
jgi:CubicO group peptidase (beta-lactamase class C family)